MSETTDASQLTELPAVARNISLPCKKCGIDRFHVVVAHTSATAAKVKCEVCGASKTFKIGVKAKPAGVKKAPRVTAAEKKAEAARGEYSQLYSKLKAEIGTGAIKPYSMKVRFELATAIEHPSFGLGFVTKSTPDRIEVAFEVGGKSLVHNRQ